MKKIYLLLLALVFCLSSCTSIFAHMDSQKVATDNFQKIFNAIQKENADELLNLFSENVRNEKSALGDSIQELFEYIDGKLQSFTVDVAIASTGEMHEGKESVELDYAVDVKTSVCTYHMAVLYCVVDEFDADNKGVEAISIISEEDWKSDYLFRVSTDFNGNYIKGITIEKTQGNGYEHTGDG